MDSMLKIVDIIATFPHSCRIAPIKRRLLSQTGVCLFTKIFTSGQRAAAEYAASFCNAKIEDARERRAQLREHLPRETDRLRLRRALLRAGLGLRQLSSWRRPRPRTDLALLKELASDRKEPSHQEGWDYSPISPPLVSEVIVGYALFYDEVPNPGMCEMVRRMNTVEGTE